jgi:hypothetical protein
MPVSTAHVVLSFANFTSVRIFRYYFAVYNCIGYNFLLFYSDFASKSTNNSILLERGRSYHSTLFLTLLRQFFSSSYTAVPINCADSAVQVYRPWAIFDPAFSLLFRSFQACFPVSNCVCHIPTYRTGFCVNSVHTCHFLPYSFV